MQLDYSEEIDSLFPKNRLYEIAKQLKQLQDEKTELIGEAMSISQDIGEQFAFDDYDIYELEDLPIGFYKELVPIEYIKAIYKKDMLRISFNFDKKKFTERQVDFVKEIVFSCIMLARIMNMPVVNFRYEWVIDYYINGFCFSSFESAKSIYIKLQEKNVLSVCNDSYFFIDDKFLIFKECQNDRYIE